MSAAPVYPERHSRRYRSSVSRPAPRRRRRTVRRRAPRRNANGLVLGYIALFGMVVAVTFGFSTLAGHSFMEHARREAIRAGERTRIARADLGRLRSRLERLTTMKSVDDWSKTRGFVAPYNPVGDKDVAEPTVVAKVEKPRNRGLKLEMTVARAEGHNEIQ